MYLIKAYILIGNTGAIIWDNIYCLMSIPLKELMINQINNYGPEGLEFIATSLFYLNEMITKLESTLNTP